MLRSADMHIQGPQIHQFNNIAPNPIPRSAFQRDFTRRMSFLENYLVPVFVDEILPGDDVNLKMNALVRLATPIKPIMDNLYLDTMFFYVPNRLLWTNWEKQQGMRVNPSDSTAFTIPVLDRTKAPMSTTGFGIGSVYDYMGLPTLVTNLGGISALFNRAYDLIWTEWFRDENLQNSIIVSTGDGPDDPLQYLLRKRNKRKDYFTSALPFPQKGDPVTINVGGSAPVVITSNGQTPTFNYLNSAAQNNRPLQVLLQNLGVAATARIDGATNANSASLVNVQFGNQSGLQGSADLSTASGITINALRQAALYQQILELDARGGTRYVESLFSRFGVVSPDFRLQRPELIGQASSRINVYAVAQTAPSAAGTTPQGNLSAYGTGIINGNHGCRYSATEHGIIIGLANVRADLTYQQGVPKMFLRSTRLDFYEPLLNGLGEQAITMKELYATGVDATDNQVFGYQERFSDYRFKNSEICGLFRSTAPGTLDIWHLSQKFTGVPLLQTAFIEENVPMDRVKAVTSEPTFLMDAFFQYNHVRPMPIRSNPGIDKL